MSAPKRIIPGMLTKEEEQKIKASLPTGTLIDPLAEQKKKDEEAENEAEANKPKAAKATEGRKAANENIVFVGNINPSLVSETLQNYFKFCGNIVSCNIVISKQNKQELQKQKFQGIEDPSALTANFAFIEFSSPSEANMALEQLNGKTIENYEIQVKKAFKNIAATNSDEPKGYGFATFNSQEAAQGAIDAKNGKELNGKAIVCNHAAKKEQKPRIAKRQPKRVYNDLPSFFELAPQSPEEVFLNPPTRPFTKKSVDSFISRSITPVDNTSVFIGRIPDQLPRFVLDCYMNEFFGPIVKTEHFQGYCLATFAYKASAAKCIMGLNKYDVAGLSNLAVYWKKEYVKKPYRKEEGAEENGEQANEDQSTNVDEVKIEDLKI
ncbi:unnamed protein product [Hanseniaspora opuntiae]